MLNLQIPLLYLIALQVVLFSFIYFILRYEEGAFYGLTSDSSYFDCLYFSMTTQSSVGYGDMGPVNSKAKFAVMLQQGCMIFDLFTGLKDIGIAS